MKTPAIKLTNFARYDPTHLNMNEEFVKIHMSSEEHATTTLEEYQLVAQSNGHRLLYELRVT